MRDPTELAAVYARSGTASMSSCNGKAASDTLLCWMAACICEGAGGAYRPETVEFAREALALLFLLTEDACGGGSYSSGGKRADLGELRVELG